LKKIVFFLLVSFYAFPQTGIGTTTPVNKFEVVTTTADPASSGLAANGNLRLGPSTGFHVLDFGLSSTSTFGWLQMRSKSAYGTTYSLGINPIGGFVGIGTSAPTSLLTVGRSDGSISAEILLNPASTTNEGGQIVFKRSLTGSTVDWTIDQYGTSASDARLRIFNGGAETNGITIKENGFIGMGTITPTVRLQVNGDIIANSIAGSSDARFKTNITSIQDPLAKVMKLRGVNFDWNQTLFPDRNFPATRSMGFIAQEVEQVIPEVVQSEKNADTYKAVHYDKVVALLVEAIKEQQGQIQQLQKQVKQLKKKR
jgi:Chaperone of endosialidase